MAFTSDSSGGAMADINVTPLVDVMLVLLIIFMVTAPIQTYPIEVNLPQRTNVPTPPKSNPPAPISLRIDASGQVYWNDSPQPIAELESRMRASVQVDPTNQPTLEIDTSPDADYGILAKVLAHAKNAQMQKIGFVQPN